MTLRRKVDIIMDYKFKCNKCGQNFIFSMPISEYTALGHKCQNPDCDGELERDMSDFAGGFIWKCHGSYAKG